MNQRCRGEPIKEKALRSFSTAPHDDLTVVHDIVCGWRVQCLDGRRYLFTGRKGIMNRDELKARINSELDVRDVAENVAQLDPDQQGKGFVCPKCGSGSGEHGTGLHHYPDTNRLYCFACGYTYGPLDLLMVATGDDYNAALQMGAELLGIEWTGKRSTVQRTPTVRRVDRTERRQTNDPATPLPDYSEYLARAREALTDDSEGAAYLADRGLRLDVARQYGIGYDAQAHRIIVPTDNGAHIARTTIGAEPKVRNPKGYPVQTSFGAFLDGTDPVHIVEGWADALAIICAGGAAVSLNGTPNIRKLVERLDSMETVPPLILAFDPDDAGTTARADMAAALDHRKLPYTDGSVCLEIDGVRRDPADSYAADPPAFANAVKMDIRAATIDPAADALVGDDAARDAFWTAFIGMFRGAERIPTGIELLDKQLGGGLYPGLIALGGTTGAGKTTLAVNIADNIAASGRPVLYIALEMSRAELYAKSLARIAYDIATDRGCIHRAPIYGAIMEGALRRLTWGIYPAVQYRDTIAPNMIIYEAVGHTPAATVRERARMIAQVRGTAPVVIVDYLQIMGADDPRLSDKQAADQNVLGLKQLSRDLDTPVIVLSSLNRAAYGKQSGQDEGDIRVTMADFKESGGIEYGCDMLLALERTDHRGPYADPRDVQLCTLKNRRGIRREPSGYRFYGGASLYVPYPGAVRRNAESCVEVDEYDMRQFERAEGEDIF